MRVWFVFAVGVAFAVAVSAQEQMSFRGTPSAIPPAQDKIWCGVMLATNADNPKKPPGELREFAPRLERVFGYNQFELVGSASNALGDKTESWLSPNDSFSLELKARRAMSRDARGGYLLNIQLFQGKRPLVDTEAKLAPGSPLFIRGPQYGHGQLILVLQVQR